MQTLFIVSIVLFAIANIWQLVVTFKESVWWGLGSLLLPFVSFVFVILHWQLSKKPFLLAVVSGAVACYAGFKIYGATGAEMAA